MTHPVLAVALLLTGWLIGLVDARNTFIRIRHDDRPGIMLSRPFGFNSSPRMELELSGLRVHAEGKKQHWSKKSAQKLKDLRFYVIEKYAEPLEEEASFQRRVHKCRFLDDYKGVITEVFNVHDQAALRDMATEAKGAPDTFKFSVPANALGGGAGGVFALFAANCMAGDLAVSFDVSVKKFNEDRSGNPNYLSVGEIELPTMYLVRSLPAPHFPGRLYTRALCRAVFAVSASLFAARTCRRGGLDWVVARPRDLCEPMHQRPAAVQVMGCIFLVALGMWTHNLYTHREHAHRIHYLMTALGVFKVLTLLAQCAMYHYIRVTGSPDGWNVAFYIFTLFRGVFLFAVIILIGTGWSYMTPFLSDNNKKVLMIVIPLQARPTPPPTRRRVCTRSASTGRSSAYCTCRGRCVP